MTSLIDVIFLLLLFFMLSSTFTRFGEIPLSAAAAGSGQPDTRPVFVTLGPDALRLNGAEASLPGLEEALAPHRGEGTPLTLLVSLRGAVSSQRLVDLLAALRALPDLSVTVLGPA